MPNIAVNGVGLNYDLTGPEDAPVVTLSNSLSSNLHMWDDQMEALSGYRVLRYDKRGHGSSSAPEGSYTLELLADDVIGLWDALGIEESHFCGLSIGGMIGQALALKKPSQLQALMLCDTSSRIPADAAPTWDERIATAEADGMAALVEGTIGRWLSKGFIALKETHQGALIGLLNPEHVRWLREHPDLPLSVQFSVDESATLFAQPQGRATFVAGSWALMHYLISGIGPLRARLPDFLEALQPTVETTHCP